jgi:hypothetical protein
MGLSLNEELKIAKDVGSHLGVEFNPSAINDEPCYKITFHKKGLFTRNAISIFYRPLTISGTIYATKDTSEILAVLNDRGKNISPDDDILFTVANLDAEIRTEMTKLHQNNEPSSKINDFPEASELLVKKDIHWNLIRTRGEDRIIGHIWFNANGKIDLYWEMFKKKGTPLKYTILTVKTNGKTRDLTKEDKQILNEFIELLKTIDKKFESKEYKNYVEGLRNKSEQQLMLENLNNPVTKVYTEFNGKKGFFLGSFITRIKYNGELYFPFDKSVWLYLYDGRFRTVEELHNDPYLQMEQKSDETFGVCQNCNKKTKFTKRMISIFVENGKKVTFGNKSLEGQIEQFYVNVCNICGNMQPWKISDEQLKKIKEDSKKMIKDEEKRRKFVNSFNKKENVNEKRLTGLIKQHMLIKRKSFN